MSTNERAAEDEYIAREEIEKQHKLAHELAARRAKEEAAALKAAHYMKCPACGNDLATINVHGVAVSRCFHCQGTFLPEAEFKKMAQAMAPSQHRIIDAVLNVFNRTGKS